MSMSQLRMQPLHAELQLSKKFKSSVFFNGAHFERRFLLRFVNTVIQLIVTGVALLDSLKMENTSGHQEIDVLQRAQHWREEGRLVALATVIETWGSAPRPAGSHLVIDSEGHFEGSVSGGCVEGAVVQEALDVIETRKATTLEFGVSDETAWQVGLSCGGRICVYVEPLI